jgi:hypothetical protein
MNLDYQKIHRLGGNFQTLMHPIIEHLQGLRALLHISFKHVLINSTKSKK